MLLRQQTYQSMYVLPLLSFTLQLWNCQLLSSLLFCYMYGFLNLEKLDSLQDCRLNSVLYHGLFMYFEVGQLKGLHFKGLFVLCVQVDKILVLLCWHMLQTVKLSTLIWSSLGWVIFAKGLNILMPMAQELTLLLWWAWGWSQTSMGNKVENLISLREKLPSSTICIGKKLKWSFILWHEKLGQGNNVIKVVYIWLEMSKLKGCMKQSDQGSILMWWPLGNERIH
jgi:hypothetical protein